ncbi:hypothetical protein BDR26DRAFT_892455 [Obelidium mucronatum]|nr:hypothetical protein BDR26DRAFT_892455 [Obelidium mucronatum]
MPANPFELLGDVDSTDTAAFVPQPKVAAPRAASPAKPAAAQQKPKTPNGDRRKNNNNGPVGDRKPRGPRKEYTPRDPNQTSDIARPDELIHNDAAENKKHTRDAHHRGDRRGGAASGGRKREFDRKSGTGREDGDKKDNDREPVEAEVEGAKDVAEEIAAENVEPVVEVIPEPEEKQVSLSEYLAQVAANKLAAAAKSRAANEGTDKKLLAAATVFEKEEEVLFAGKAQKEKKVKEAKEKKAIFEVEFKFADETPAFRPREERAPRDGDRAPRGGRGGARGGARPATGGRGGAKGASAAPRGGAKGGVNIADENAFPSLGSK